MGRSSIAIVIGLCGAAVLVACQALIGLDKFEKERDACTFVDCAVADVIEEPDSGFDYFGDASAAHRWVAWPMPNPAKAEVDANNVVYSAPFQADAGDAGKVTVVRDTITSLEWMKDPPAAMGFLEAGQFCEGLGNNFRLPTRIELVSLWDYTQPTNMSAFDPVFGGSDGTYWTQSPTPTKTSAWVVDFSKGGIVSTRSVTGQANVRCVR